MKYITNYAIISINYNEKKRTTRVTIVCEDTGEVFYGTARRHKNDKLNIALGTNLALARAVRKMILADLEFSENTIKDNDWDFNFNC